MLKSNILSVPNQCPLIRVLPFRGAGDILGIGVGFVFTL